MFLRLGRPWHSCLYMPRRLASTARVPWPSTSRPTPFEIFQLDEKEKIDSQALKRQFIALVHQYHPDKQRDDKNAQDNLEKFRLVKSAYEILKDDSRRAKYLTSGAGWPYPPKHLAQNPFNDLNFLHPFNDADYISKLRYARARARQQNMGSPFASSSSYTYYSFSQNGRQGPTQGYYAWSGPGFSGSRTTQGSGPFSFNDYTQRHQPGWGGQGQYTTNGRFAAYVAAGVFLASPLFSYIHLQFAQANSTDDIPVPSEPDARRHVEAMKRLRQISEQSKALEEQRAQALKALNASGNDDYTQQFSDPYSQQYPRLPPS